MYKIDKLISTNGKISKSKSSFGNYKVDAKREWTDHHGKIRIVAEGQFFFKIKDAKKFIQGLPII